MEDPIREGVVEAVEVARRARIRVCMITGDYRRTAERIGRNIGLFRDGDETLDGDELARLDDRQLQERVSRVAVFARIRPNTTLSDRPTAELIEPASREEFTYGQHT